MTVKRFPLKTIPLPGGDQLTILTTGKDEAWAHCERVLRTVEALRSEVGPHKLQRQELADQLIRMLKGESFDDVFQINRRALQGQRDAHGDYWLAQEYWLLRRQGVPEKSARHTVAADWNVHASKVKRLATLGRKVCESYIDELLNGRPADQHPALIDARLAVCAEERDRSSRKVKRPKAKKSRR